MKVSERHGKMGVKSLARTMALLLCLSLLGLSGLALFGCGEGESIVQVDLSKREKVVAPIDRKSVV